MSRGGRANGYCTQGERNRMDLSVVVGRVLKVRKEGGKETNELFEERISRWESSSELPHELHQYFMLCNRNEGRREGLITC